LGYCGSYNLLKSFVATDCWFKLCYSGSAILFVHGCWSMNASAIILTLPLQKQTQIPNCLRWTIVAVQFYSIMVGV